MKAIRAKLTANGQISLPAALRRRWSASSVLVIDKGDYAIVRPMPLDPIASLQGAYAGAGRTSEETRSVERAVEIDRERTQSGQSLR